MIFWGQLRSMCQWASLGETTQERAGNKVQIYGCSFFFSSLSFSSFFLNDHHPRAHSNSECVGTGFYECVLSLGISETFLHPVRIILFTLGLQYSLLHWPKFQPFHQKESSSRKKKSPGEQNTPVRVRIHENNYECVWKSLPAIFPAFLAVLMVSLSGEKQHSVSEEKRKKSVRRRWRSFKFRINTSVANSNTAASLTN